MTTTTTIDYPPGRRPLNPLLASYYSTLPDISSPSTIQKRIDPTELDSAQFDVDKALNIILNEKSLPNLLKRDNELILEMKHIDGNRKTLIYENYTKLIGASDTIKSMREKVESIELEMAKLSVQVQDITGLAANLHGTFTHRKVQVSDLKCAVTLVNRLQVLATLPRKLAQSLMDGTYLRTVQFYSASKSTLQRYVHLPLFAKVNSECTALVHQIQKNVVDTLNHPTKRDTNLLIEYINVLVALDLDSPDQLLIWFCQGALATMITKINTNQPWVNLLEQLVSQFRQILMPNNTSPTTAVPYSPSLTDDRPKLGPRSPSQFVFASSSPIGNPALTQSEATGPSIHLSPTQVQSFETHLCDLIKDAFGLWDKHSTSMHLSDRLAVHRELISDLVHVPTIAPVLNTAITQSTHQIITHAIRSIIDKATSPVQDKIHKLANWIVSKHGSSNETNLESVMDLVRAKIGCIMEQANQVQDQHVYHNPAVVTKGHQLPTATGLESESKYKAWELEKQNIQVLINQAPSQFINSLTQPIPDQSDLLLSTKDLIRIRMAQKIADGGVSQHIGPLDVERVIVEATKINEHGLVTWVYNQMTKFEVQVMHINTPDTMSTHPKGVEVGWSKLGSDLEQIIDILKQVFIDTNGVDVSVTDSVTSTSHRRPGHHRQSSSVTSIGSVIHSGPTRGGSSVNLSHQERMQLNKYKMYVDRTVYFPQVTDFDTSVVCVILTLVRSIVKTYVELVRSSTLNKLAFQQVLVNVEFVRSLVKRICSGPVLKSVYTDKPLIELFDEVVTSAYRRCVDPVFLPRDSLAALITTAERVDEE